MGKNSKISWTDHTFNPWIGCSKVSTGCKNCYAEREMDQRYHKVRWGPQGTRLHTSPNYPMMWNEDHWVECVTCGWRGSLDDCDPDEKFGGYNCPECGGSVETTRQRVFCASLADVFEDHPDVNHWRDGLWKLIEATPSLDWMLLTKRIENVEAMIPESWRMGSWPRHVWLGISAEDQQHFDIRMPMLEVLGRHFKIPVIFLSAEPLLGPIDMIGWLDDEDELVRQLDWVIVGGESGPAARPMHPRWLVQIQDQCLADCVPFFFKQWGEWCALGARLKEDPSAQDQVIEAQLFKHKSHGIACQVEGEDGLVLWRVGKRIAGDQLEGQTWHDWPGREIQ